MAFTAVDIFLPLACRFALVPRVSWPDSDSASNCCTLAFAASGEIVPAVNDIAIENGPELRVATPSGEKVGAGATETDREGNSTAPEPTDVGGVVWVWLNDPAADINLPILVLGRATNSTVAIPMPVANTILNACSSAVRFTPGLWA